MHQMWRASLAVGVSVAAAALVAGCGGNESTASSTPTLAPPTVSEEPSPTETEPEPTEPESEPEPEPELPEDDDYLSALREQGVTPYGDGSVARDTAVYVCAAEAEGAPQEEIEVLVTALVAAEAGLVGAAGIDPDAAAQVYIDAAREHVCE